MRVDGSWEGLLALEDALSLREASRFVLEIPLWNNNFWSSTVRGSWILPVYFSLVSHTRPRAYCVTALLCSEPSISYDPHHLPTHSNKDAWLVYNTSTTFPSFSIVSNAAS
jgi:hypothetical protein